MMARLFPKASHITVAAPAVALGALVFPLPRWSTAEPVTNRSIVNSSLRVSRDSVNEDMTPHPGLLRFPDVSATQIVFLYANNLWVVGRTGGVASPLASAPGPEMFPKFSADGRTIAFVGNYEGGRDIYTIPTTGGVPFRITHHPATERLCDWTPDGGLLFSASGLSGIARAAQLFTVAATGGMPNRVDVPYGGSGAIDASGQWLAYTPYSLDFRTWKRYEGGWASDIWLFNLKDHSSRRMTDWPGTDTAPMWNGDTVYYLSDDGSQHRLNIWSYDLKSARRQQITSYSDWDIKFPSIGPGPSGQGEIVYQYGTGLYLLNLANGQSSEVKVSIPGDKPKLAEQEIDASKFIHSSDISSTGKRAVFEARGDIFTVPADEGVTRDLTRTSGYAERSPTWSPDGRWIAYFSDATGEYQLYIRQSDGLGETRQLTEDEKVFLWEPEWSPDSKWIAFSDKTATLYVINVGSGEIRKVDHDPGSIGNSGIDASWSSDSRWLTYARAADDNITNNSIWIYNLEQGKTVRVTSGMFSDSRPTFDEDGDYIFYVSRRSFNPSYSDFDTSFIYDESQILLAAPLRHDVKSPYLARNDEESWADKGNKEHSSGDERERKEKSADDSTHRGAANGDGNLNSAARDDGISGIWNGSTTLPDQGPISFIVQLVMEADHTITGSLTHDNMSLEVSGSFDPASKELTLTVTDEGGQPVATLTLKVDGATATGKGNYNNQNIEVTLTRQAHSAEKGESTPSGEHQDVDKSKMEKKKKVEIDLVGFESRAFALPIANGSFGPLAVNDKNQLLFVRMSGGGGRRGRGGEGEAGGSGAGIRLFDLKDDKRQEKEVAAGAFSFSISGDHKKILYRTGRTWTVHNASPGGESQSLSTSDMRMSVDPRAEWMQLFTDTWRIYRDFFYDPNMHGVNWPAMREHYAKMIEDCANREDVGYVISEMISELNVGHAYYNGGDVEDEPTQNVGMLGVDWALENGAYRIRHIIRGADWDSDARNPLLEQGLNIKEGDYLLEVDGVKVDVSMDPWAAFIGLAGKATILTVSEKPVLDDSARKVVVKPVGSEHNLRYRAWIERNREYVAGKTHDAVGYIYVPDTGFGGQNDLVRQYFGQLQKAALIIDERWNGGGQIPTRFIELLNRPVTNYWALRDGHDWTWPPDGQHGPKCMLINGPSGSGGDAFPYYFRQAGLGKLIGTRTWGGLVGIAGNPTLIDGASITVPNFGVYGTNGQWIIEGHGVDPDLEVIDDPALMVNGGDPQLDAAVTEMLGEIKAHPYIAPHRPAYPDRSGMGPNPPQP